MIVSDLCPPDRIYVVDKAALGLYFDTPIDAPPSAERWMARRSFAGTRKRAANESGKPSKNELVALT